ncbi:polysaccharide deacetylase family protein [Yoonia sp.]|nr:polysaccharide deacetylase family protein [Yoonia sp.]
MDDLPLWPQSYPPAGYSAEGIVKSIRLALRENGIEGVYSFSNSWPLDKHPDMSVILDDWVADSHHIANHTHAHIELPDVSAEAFIVDIDTAGHKLSRWVSQAPLKLFRHPLCHWGETEDKLRKVNCKRRPRPINFRLVVGGAVNSLWI